MNSIQFNYMTVEMQVDYFNTLMKYEPSIKDVCRIIGISPATIKKAFTNEGYTYSKEHRAYIKDVNEFLIYENNKTAVMANKSNEMDIMKANIIGLAENYQDIQEVISWYKSGAAIKNIIEVVEGIKINLPEDINPDFRTTVRLNNTVYIAFQEFCKLNKEFTAKDLHSQALQDFITRHK